MVGAFFHGMVLAFGLIIPLGAQNIFVFNQGAARTNLLKALPAVITAGFCDTLLILLAVLGVSLIILTFAWIKMILFSVGILFLLYMGWSIWRSPVSFDTSPGSGEGLSASRQIAFAASVSLLNPHAILDTIGVIGTSSLAYSGEEKWAFTIACILVSWIWFFGLALAGRLLRKIDSSGKRLKRVNQLSAIIIWGVAVYIGVQMMLSENA